MSKIKVDDTEIIKNILMHMTNVGYEHYEGCGVHWFDNNDDIEEFKKTVLTEPTLDKKYPHNMVYDPHENTAHWGSNSACAREGWVIILPDGFSLKQAEMF